MSDATRAPGRPSGGPARSTPSTAAEMVALGRGFLEAKGFEEARLESELIVAHVLGLDRLRLFLDLQRPVEKDEVDRARALFVRRAAAEPVAYLTGTREFYGRAFRVGPGVLVPRPETELLVDLARARAAARTEPVAEVADLGTGSGCLAVTLFHELGHPRVTALDVSPEALVYARENAARHAAEVRVLEGDGVPALIAACPGGVDLVVCNPPYVDPAGAGALPADVRDHEPALALFAPPGDPDRWARELVAQRARLLRPGGGLLVELGLGQAERVRALARELGATFRLHADYGGIERVLEVEYD